MVIFILSVCRHVSLCMLDIDFDIATIAGTAEKLQAIKFKVCRKKGLGIMLVYWDFR